MRCRVTGREEGAEFCVSGLRFNPAPAALRTEAKATQRSRRQQLGAGDDSVEKRDVFKGSSHWANRVTSMAQRNHLGSVLTTLRTPIADGRAQSRDSVQRRRDTNRAARICAQAYRRHSGRDCNARPTRRAGNHTVRVIRIAREAGKWREVRGRDAECEFMPVGFAKHDSARGQQALENDRVVIRLEAEAGSRPRLTALRRGG
jgi:hypothetical protein